MLYTLKNFLKTRSFVFSDKFFFAIILFISVGVLVSAFSLEFFFNFPPCKLCVYQRIPYFALIFVSILYQANKYFILKPLTFFLLVINFLIAGFHSLVERKLIDFNIGCSSSNVEFENIDDLRNFLEKTPITKCDEITFSILGFSLANLNLIISIILIILCVGIFKNDEQKL